MTSQNPSSQNPSSQNPSSQNSSRQKSSDSPSTDKPWGDPRTLLFTLWTFVMFNYVYGDILALMDPRLLAGFLAGEVDGLVLSPGFLYAAAILMQIPMVALLLTRLLPRRGARWVNLGAGGLKTAVVLGTLFMGSNTATYITYSVVEMLITTSIVVVAWRWTAESPAPALHAAAPAPA